MSGSYRKNLKNRNFDKEDPQNLSVEREAIAQGQDTSEHTNFEKKTTTTKTDSSGCFGIKAYEKLKEKGKEIRLLSSLSLLLEWDQETYMPKEGIELRSSQIELVSSLIHEQKTSETYKNLLKPLIELEMGKLKTKELDKRKESAVLELRSEYLKETLLPNAFVKKLAKVHSRGTHGWQKARKENNFELFLPHFSEIISLQKEKANYLQFEDHPYDALLDLYESGMTTKKLDELFGILKPFLTDLTKKLSKSKKGDGAFLSANFPIEEQKEFTHFLLEKMGIDFDRARLDYSVHPFCMGLSPHDVRLTTHTSPTMFFQNISGVMHEGGHALYELGLPPEELGTPLGEFCSMGIHESQSKWWECFIGQGAPFWEFALPLLQKKFPKQLKNVTLNPFLKALNRVEPSLIRIYADEVTYILHIILRYEIERDFIKGDISPADLPKIWNEKMGSSLGIIPDTDANGCLQDIHWSCGLIGYFPTYALGNLYAGQLFETYTKSFPDWEKEIKGGDFASMRHFLLEKIHRFGKEHHPLALVEKATGAPLSPKPFMQYLQKKYSI